MRIAIFEAMNRPEADQRLWFVVDELDTLGNMTPAIRMPAPSFACLIGMWATRPRDIDSGFVRRNETMKSAVPFTPAKDYFAVLQASLEMALPPPPPVAVTT
jgi:hypothetical protein